MVFLHKRLMSYQIHAYKQNNCGDESHCRTYRHKQYNRIQDNCEKLKTKIIVTFKIGIFVSYFL